MKRILVFLGFLIFAVEAYPQSSNVNNVYVDFNAKKLLSGINIKVDMNIRNMQGKNCNVVAKFFDTNGHAILDKDGYILTRSIKAKPSSSNSHYSNLEFFVANQIVKSPVFLVKIEVVDANKLRSIDGDYVVKVNKSTKKYSIVSNKRNTGNTINREAASKSNNKNSVQKYNCPQCGGRGYLEMNPGGFMSPTYVCGGCNGKKFVTASEYRQIVQAYYEVQKIVQPTQRSSNNSGLKGKCPSCGGSGRCTNCAGQGFKTYEKYYTGNGTGITECPICNQSGKCTTCNGTGKGI